DHLPAVPHFIGDDSRLVPPIFEARRRIQPRPVLLHRGELRNGLHPQQPKKKLAIVVGQLVGMLELANALELTPLHISCLHVSLLSPLPAEGRGRDLKPGGHPQSPTRRALPLWTPRPEDLSVSGAPGRL